MELYVHTKTGKIYEIISQHVLHSETMERMVVYRSTLNGACWVRPYSMFFEEIELNGKLVPRFQKMEASHDGQSGNGSSGNPSSP